MRCLMQDREAGECGARALPTTKTISLSLSLSRCTFTGASLSELFKELWRERFPLSLSPVSVGILLLILPRSHFTTSQPTFVTSVRALISVAVQTPPRRLMLLTLPVSVYINIALPHFPIVPSHRLSKFQCYSPRSEVNKSSGSNCIASRPFFLPVGL